MPHSCAMAGRCSAALVDPPDAATTTAAFSKALRVTISRGRRPIFSKFITAAPEATAYSSRLLYGAGAPAEPGSARPIASDTQAIVLAVNCPPQDPAEGQAAHSNSCSSSSDSLP